MIPLQITNEQKNSILTNFQAFLEQLLPGTGNITFTAAWERFLPKLAGDKKIISYSPLAKVKMRGLVQTCTDEIGWHGTAYRTEYGYHIEDVFTYPQTVTGATITCDADAYAKWNMMLEDDVINNMRFHGHSHVNMGVTPSGVDMTFRQDLVAKLDKDDFFIFLIINKSDAINHSVYDLKDGILYEDKDLVITTMLDNNQKLSTWIDEQMKHVTKYATTTNWAAQRFVEQQETSKSPIVPLEKNPKRLPTKHYDEKMRRWVVTTPYGSKCYYTSEPKGDYLVI